MNTRKLFYSFMAFLVLAASAACTQNNAEDSVYEFGIDRLEVGEQERSIDRDEVGEQERAIDRDEVGEQERKR